MLRDIIKQEDEIRENSLAKILRKFFFAALEFLLRCKWNYDESTAISSRENEEW